MTDDVKKVVHVRGKEIEASGKFSVFPPRYKSQVGDAIQVATTIVDPNLPFERQATDSIVIVSNRT